MLSFASCTEFCCLKAVDYRLAFLLTLNGNNYVAFYQGTFVCPVYITRLSCDYWI